MRLFAIDNDNTITAFPAAEQIPEGQEHFASEKELAKLAANWPADRLVQVWNSFAGVAGFGDDLKPVKKFTDRKSAVARIWKAIQRWTPPPRHRRPTLRRRPRGRGRRPRPSRRARPRRARAARRPSSWTCSSAADGATLKDMMAATDWQAHSVRGFISGSLTKKMGLKIESIKREDGERALPCWHNSTSSLHSHLPPPATTVGGFFVLSADSA